jgi:hypothetical protein
MFEGLDIDGNMIIIQNLKKLKEIECECMGQNIVVQSGH